MKPMIFLAFANDKGDHTKYLRNLPAEHNGIREALQEAQKQDLCEVIERANLTAKQFVDVFQDSRYRDRIAVFHFGGHADGYQLLPEDLHQTLPNSIAHGSGLVSFLSKQQGLKLVFFNGCTSERQARELSEAGIPAVIGTVSEINDKIATDLAIRFYGGIGQGLDIERAWAEAQDAIYMQNGKDNLRGLYRKDLKEVLPKEEPWRLYKGKNFENWKLKTPNDMLAEQLLCGLLSLWESGGAEFLRNIGADVAKSVAKDTLKELGKKAINFFKGKPAENTIDALENAVRKGDAEKFQAESEAVLQLLKNALATDDNFKQEVESMLNGLDSQTKQDLDKQSAIIIQNSKNVVAASTFTNITGGVRIGDNYGTEPK